MSETVLSTDAPPERKGRRWVFVTLLVLLPLGLLAGGYIYLSLAADADLRDAMTEASHLEPDGWRLFDLETRRDAPEPDQNSAFRVLAVKQTLPGGWGTAPAFYELFEDLPPEARLNGSQLAARQAELA